MTNPKMVYFSIWSSESRRYTKPSKLIFILFSVKSFSCHCLVFSAVAFACRDICVCSAINVIFSFSLLLCLLTFFERRQKKMISLCFSVTFSPTGLVKMYVFTLNKQKRYTFVFAPVSRELNSKSEDFF